MKINLSEKHGRNGLVEKSWREALATFESLEIAKLEFENLANNIMSLLEKY